MKKHVFFGYWYYRFIFINFFVFSAITIGIMTYSLIEVSPEDNSSIPMLYWLVPLFTVILITVMAVLGYYMLQWVVVSEEGIKARCLWCTIRKLKWEEVKEIRYEMFYVNREWAYSSGWYVFDDGAVRRQRSGIFNKKSHITLRATKRAEEVIGKYWQQPIVTRVMNRKNEMNGYERS